MSNVSIEPMTTKRLLLMRHAKSDWSVEGQSDHDRSLNARGRGDAPRIAQWLLDEQLVPDAVLSSTAMRTRETISRMNETWRAPVTNVTFSESLYLASPEMILHVVCTSAGAAQTLLVLGHNPGMSYLASMLSRERIELPTAAIAIFDCVLKDWSDLQGSTEVRFVRMIRPKAL